MRVMRIKLLTGTLTMISCHKVVLREKSSLFGNKIEWLKCLIVDDETGVEQFMYIPINEETGKGNLFRLLNGETVRFSAHLYLVEHYISEERVEFPASYLVAINDKQARETAKLMQYIGPYCNS